MPRLLFLSALLLCCGHSTPNAAPTDAAADSPPWLGDAGVVVRPPTKRPLREMCGIASNPGDFPIDADARSTALRKGYFDAAIDLGGVMIRRDFVFSEIEPARGTFDFTKYDRLLDEAKTRGVRILGTLDYGTKWANAAATDDYFPPTNPGDFATYASTTAKRYAGRVVGWEIWNEPNMGIRFWKPTVKGDPAAYATLLADAHDAIVAADPATPVLLGGTVFTPQFIDGAMDWLMAAYAARPDLATKFEIAGVHTYEQYPPIDPPEIPDDYAHTDAPLEDKIWMHQWLLSQHGAATKPIWITELGWPSHPAASDASHVDDDTQAHFMVRATILAAHAGADAVFWYTLRDGANPENFPPEDAFGLLKNDVDPTAGREATKKPVFQALKTLLATTADRSPTDDDAGVKGLPDDGRAIVFRGADPNDRVVAVWTITSSATVTFDRAAELIDEQGKPIQLGAKSTTIGPSVVYAVEHP